MTSTSSEATAGGLDEVTQGSREARRGWSHAVVQVASTSSRTAPNSLGGVARDYRGLGEVGRRWRGQGRCLRVSARGEEG